MRLGQILNSQPVEVQSRAKAWSKRPSRFCRVSSDLWLCLQKFAVSQCKPSGPRQRLPCRMCSWRNSFYRPFRWITLHYACYLLLFKYLCIIWIHNWGLFDAMLATSSKSFLLAPFSFVRKRSQCHKPRRFFWHIGGRCEQLQSEVWQGDPHAYRWHDQVEGAPASRASFIWRKGNM